MASQRMTTGKVLKLFRLTVGENFTASDLAEKIGVSKAYISAVENNKREPGIKGLKKFSEAFNVPVYVIVRIVEEANENSWSHERTFLEVVRTYLEYNDQN